jgi:hypothetical protein
MIFFPLIYNILFGVKTFKFLDSTILFTGMESQQTFGRVFQYDGRCKRCPGFSFGIWK